MNITAFSIRKYKLQSKDVAYWEAKIRLDFNLSQIYTRSVNAFGIAYVVYSDPACRHQIAEILS